MNKIIFYTIVLLLLIYSTKFAQCDLNQLIIRLNNESVAERIEAIDEILNCKLEEALDALESRMLIEDDVTVSNYLLYSIDIFHSPNVINIAHQLINNVTNLNYYNNEFTIYESKIKSTWVLFNNSDYSTAQIVIDYLDRYLNTINLTQLNMLDLIIHNLPSLELAAKNKLENIVHSNATDIIRAFALEILFKNYGDEYENYFLEFFYEDEYWIMRDKALECLLGINYFDIKSLLYQQLSDDKSYILRSSICKKILNNFGEPMDLRTVLAYQPTEPDETTQELMGYLIQFFIPPRPTVTTEEMIENLITYNNELLQYGWITEYPVYNSYKKILEKTQESYRSQSLPDLCENLVALLQRAENQHGGPLLTEEGYKFLHYHGTYIKENVEQELGICEEREK